ncbi:uncharacterized protein MYCFIDRAFT_175021 [Pseudocercospora fijiensis CIRAD86]|uniref:Uncharacterized protein n=1 Tax=Pseudocercospora fijiensis (strain CIRAD86) TaxID=383855 RepID=M3AG79_PSEFD|nr:uncharacterized protein MYCFIDRAFT_175021 [Pseudocercospora fijiensis CIRAD86]EME83596.1 hypothetical protein MYCFIDRAFT_175021 [Pseudocercospora fijiensis CIRAD86]
MPITDCDYSLASEFSFLSSTRLSSLVINSGNAGYPNIFSRPHPQDRLVRIQATEFKVAARLLRWKPSLLSRCTAARADPGFPSRTSPNTLHRHLIDRRTPECKSLIFNTNLRARHPNNCIVPPENSSLDRTTGDPTARESSQESRSQLADIRHPAGWIPQEILRQGYLTKLHSRSFPKIFAGIQKLSRREGRWLLDMMPFEHAFFVSSVNNCDLILERSNQIYASLLTIPSRLTECEGIRSIFGMGYHHHVRSEHAIRPSSSRERQNHVAKDRRTLSMYYTAEQLPSPLSTKEAPYSQSIDPSIHQHFSRFAYISNFHDSMYRTPKFKQTSPSVLERVKRI